jgi:hypothetical protein
MRRPVSYKLPGVLEVVQSPHIPEQGFRLGVTGGRDFSDVRFVWNTLLSLHSQYQITEIGAGCALGLDKIVLEWAQAHHIPWRCYIADWDLYDEQAGSIRNIAYLEDFEPDQLAVFAGGRGTTHCARHARRTGIERVFYETNSDPLKEATRWG